MIEFWLAVGLLLLVGTAFLLVPVLRGRRAQAEEDRTALNVALYQERLAELTAQREAGTLTVRGRGDLARSQFVYDPEFAYGGQGFDLAPLSSRVGTARLGRASGLVLFASEGGRYVELRRA